MRNIIFAALVILLNGKYATAQMQEAVNDLPQVLWSCHETVNGAEVLDGYKELTLSKDQFGTIYIKVVQKDQLSGDSVLLDRSDIILEEPDYIPFIPSELYTADGLEFFINIIPGNTPKSGHLTYTTEGNSLETEFSCRK